MHKIILSQTNEDILARHANNEKPNESCAILLGNYNKVSKIILTENIDKSNKSFTISNNELIDIYNYVEKKKTSVISIFHSHPNSNAVPSLVDKKYMIVNPIVWIIYSCVNKNFKAYILESNIVKNIPIVRE